GLPGGMECGQCPVTVAVSCPSPIFVRDGDAKILDRLETLVGIAAIHDKISAALEHPMVRVAAMKETVAIPSGPDVVKEVGDRGGFVFDKQLHVDVSKKRAELRDDIASRGTARKRQEQANNNTTTHTRYE